MPGLDRIKQHANLPLIKVLVILALAILMGYTMINPQGIKGFCHHHFVELFRVFGRGSVPVEIAATTLESLSEALEVGCEIHGQNKKTVTVKAN